MGGRWLLCLGPSVHILVTLALASWASLIFIRTSKEFFVLPGETEARDVEGGPSFLPLSHNWKPGFLTVTVLSALERGLAVLPLC